MENQTRAKQSPGAAEWMVSSFFILPSAFWESPFPAFLGLRTDQFDRLRYFPTHFVLKNFTQRNVGYAKIPHVTNQRTAQTAATGIQLAHAARNEVHQYVRVADFLGGSFAKFSVHNGF